VAGLGLLPLTTAEQQPYGRIRKAEPVRN